MKKIALILMAIVLPYIYSVAQDKLSARNILDRTAERMLVSGEAFAIIAYSIMT